MENEINTSCNCKWVKCKRHGDCAACIEHHKRHKKHPEPFCKRNPPKGKRIQNS